MNRRKPLPVFRSSFIVHRSSFAASAAADQAEVDEPDKSKEKRQRKEPMAKAEGKEKKLRVCSESRFPVATGGSPVGLSVQETTGEPPVATRTPRPRCWRRPARR